MKKRIFSLLLSAVVFSGALSDSVAFASEAVPEEIPVEISEESSEQVSDEATEEIIEDENSEIIAEISGEGLETDLEENADESEKEKSETEVELKEFEPVKVKNKNVMKAVFGDESLVDLELNGDGDSVLSKSKYDPRVDAPEIVTETKNQNPYGTCWAHGAIASVETGLAKKGITDNTVNLSEMHLAYFAFNEAYDPLGISNDDIPVPTPAYLNRGGNVGDSITTFSNWHGIASEKDYPYTYQTVEEMKPEDSLSADYILSNAYVINGLDLEANDRKAVLKKLVADYGAVAIAYYSDDSLYNYTEEYTSYYYNGYESCNHEVALVGWDDEFPVENFRVQPSAPGAWILRNSWGDDWADGGYFYISYEDTSLGIEAAAFDAVEASKYDNNYHHCNISDYGFHDEVEGVAEVFEMKKGKEELSAVSIMLGRDSVDYKLSLYKLSDENVKDPTAGELVLSQTGVTGLAGLHTIELEKKIEAEFGDVFSIVFTFNEPVDIWTASIYTGNVVYPGESFYNKSDNWADFSYEKTNARINLLTKTVSEEISDYCTVTYKNINGRVVDTKKVKKGNKLPALKNKKAGYKYVVDGDANQIVESDTVVKVLEEAIEYKIDYVLNGGYFTEEAPTTYTIETESFYIPYPEKPNCEFYGWEWSNNKVEDGCIKKGTYGDITFTAYFGDEYVEYYDGEIELETTEYSLEIGEELVVNFIQGPGNYVPISYAIEDDSIVGFDEEGRKIARKPGTVQIVIGIPTSSGDYREIPITVTVIDIKGIKISPSDESEPGVINYREGSEVSLYAPIGSKIYYTLDGKEPTTKSTIYKKPFKLTKDTEFKAFYVNNGTKSEVVTKKFIFRKAYATFAKNKFTVNVGDKIKYEIIETPELMDGVDSYEYMTLSDWNIADIDSYENEIIACKPGKVIVDFWYILYNGEMVNSSIEVTIKDSNRFFISPTLDKNVADYEFDWYLEGIRIFAPKDTEIYYTLDGTKPTVENGIFYENAFSVGETTTVKAIYVKRNRFGKIIKTSPVIEQTFRKKLDAPKVKNNNIVLTVGEEEKIIIDEYPDYVDDMNQVYMYYTYDNVHVTVDENGIIKALAAGECTVDCGVDRGFDEIGASATINVTVVNPDSLTILPNKDSNNGVYSYNQGEKLFIAAPDGCDIFYTTDGTEPTNESTSYTRAFTLSEDSVVKAIAMKDGVVVDRIEKSYKYYRLKPLITNNVMTLKVGEQAKVEGVIAPDDSTDPSDIRVISGDESIARIDDDGTIWAFAEGKVSIEVDMLDHEGNMQYAFFKLIVSPAEVFDIVTLHKSIYTGDEAFIIAPKGADIFYAASAQDGFCEYNKEYGIYLEGKCNIRAFYTIGDFTSDIIEKQIVAEMRPRLVASDKQINIGESMELSLLKNGQEVKLDKEAKVSSALEIFDFSITEEGKLSVTAIDRGISDISMLYTDENGRSITVYSENVIATNGRFDVSGVKDAVYTGKPITMSELCAYEYVNDEETKLEYGKDYSVAYLKNTNVGKASVIITGKGRCRSWGKQTINFNILPENISNAYAESKVILNKNKNKRQSFKVYYEGKLLKEKKDYTLTKNEDGSYTAVAASKSNYTGELAINPIYCENANDCKLKRISKATVVLNRSKFTYNGKEICPKIVSVSLPGVGELSPEDYFVAYYQNNVNAGKAKVVIAGRNQYVGTVVATYTICKSIIAESEFARLEDAKIYSKAGDNTIRFTSNKNILGKDYKLKYINNKNVGTATAIITGVGNRTGEIRINYEIIAEDISTFTALNYGNNKFRLFDLDGIELTNKVDYVIKNDESGFQFLVAKEGGNYAGEVYPIDCSLKTGTKNIASKSVKFNYDAEIDTYGQPFNYMWAENCITAKDGENALEAYTDYITATPNYHSTTGTIKVFVIGINEYSGIKELTIKLK